jgi:3-deoxy-manno-octulosonate cytidylyltransferase (CMP-KDO synthetase)
MKALGVIPARYPSTRLPGKPLVSIAGKPMIQHVWERARQASSLSGVVVATDDARILDAVKAFGGEAVMTRSDHRSGSERVAEVAAARKDVDIFVNVQGDEPLIEPQAIDQAVEAMREDSAVIVATIAVLIRNPADIMDPNVVKTVLDFDGNGLYFSRAPIPWVRDRDEKVHVRHLKHLGLYAYRRDALLEFPTFPQGELERIEQLEQLRWLENGYRIRVVETERDSIGVDVPEDVRRVEQILARG